MAENETLDLWDRYSGRWRQLLRNIENDEPVDDIADEAVRCLYKTFKNLVELLPLDELLSAAKRGEGAIRDLVRGLTKARDYAELFAQHAAIETNSVRLLEGVARAATDRFLGQIEMKVIGNGHWPDTARFRVLREDIKTRMQDGITRLARQIAEHPTEKPRMPARSAEQKEKDQRDLLNLSLQPRRSGTHG